MTPLIVIVADDLTGAADCGVACTAAGLSTVVVFSEASRARDLAADAIAFDTDTRRQLPEVAGAATELAVRQLCRGAGVRVVYKKIDSTLRGNFAVEIAAARRASAGLLVYSAARGVTALAPPLAIVAPAFPATGRTTRRGRMFLQGTPLEESEVWRNEGIIGIADVPTQLQTGAGMHTAFVDLETIRAHVETLAAALAQHATAGIEAVVCDAETEEDLCAIAHAAARLHEPVVLAGSAGLARYLPQAFDLPRKRESRSYLEATRSVPKGKDSHTSDSKPPIAVSRAQLLFVVGSMSQVSRAQLRNLADEPGVRALTLSPRALRAGAGSILWRDGMRLLDEAINGGDDVALALGLGEGIDFDESADLSRALAQFLLPLVLRFSGLLCTGGETARALLTAAGAAGIRLVGEVEPGVPLGTVEGWHDLPIVTKAGAFGAPQTLVRCRAALRNFLALRT
jgi:D-threonate/D-erythronate kinase